MFNLWLNLRCAGLKQELEARTTPQFEPLVSISAGAQNVDNLRRCGAYPLIVQHHVQALVVGNRAESGGDNRLLFGALVLEATALHLRMRRSTGVRPPGWLCASGWFSTSGWVCAVSARSCSDTFPPVCSSPAAAGVSWRVYPSSPSLEENPA